MTKKCLSTWHICVCNEYVEQCKCENEEHYCLCEKKIKYNK